MLFHKQSLLPSYSQVTSSSSQSRVIHCAKQELLRFLSLRPIVLFASLNVLNLTKWNQRIEQSGFYYLQSACPYSRTILFGSSSCHLQIVITSSTSTSYPKTMPFSYLSLPAQLFSLSFPYSSAWSCSNPKRRRLNFIQLLP